MYYSSLWKGFLLSLFFLYILFYSAKSSYAVSFFYPMDKYNERQSVKGFGQFIDDQFYKGKENLFPYNRFYGYHAGVDLETFADEKSKPIPVFAISSGTITYVGSLSGYGGVILLKLDGENVTALYGHVKIKDLQFKIGAHIDINDSPIVITYLGDEFSSETSGERKHLHFAIHKGTDLYFHGHETSPSILDKKWYDPTVFLQNKNAKEPFKNAQPTPTKYISKQIKTNKKNTNVLNAFFEWLKTFLL